MASRYLRIRPYLKRYQSLLIALVLVIILASRIPRLPGLEPDVDETWSVWHTIGTPQQIIDWTPYDEPPLSYLIIGAWRGVTGINPVIVRLLSVYIFVLGAAILYLVTRKMKGGVAALLTILAYAAFGYGVVVSTWIRPYVFVLALTPLALWLTIRYFERPSVARAGLLAVCMAAMIYIHSTTAFFLAVLCVYTLIVYGKHVWRWWMPGLMSLVLTLPEIVNKFQHMLDRANAPERMKLEPLGETLRNLYSAYVGWGIVPLLWLALFIIATFLIIRRHSLKRPVIALLLWVLSPMAMYYIGPLVGVFSERHLIWIMIGVVMWIGWGLAYLPHFGSLIVAVILVITMFMPFPPNDRDKRPWLEYTMNNLKQYIQWGDVVIVDPACTAATPDEWNYYVQAYFPQGLQFVKNPEGYRRIWYVKADGWQDKKLEARIRQNRVEGLFFGPWNFLFRLYEAPPDITGIPFENGLRFHGAEVLGQTSPGMVAFRTKETVRLRLWWSIDRPIERDYSIGVYLNSWRNGDVLVQVDSPPRVTDAPQETSRWVFDRYYVEERDLGIPATLYPGQFTITMAVYQWWDNIRIFAPGVDQNKALAIQSVYIKAFP